MTRRIIYIAGPMTGRTKEDYMTEFAWWEDQIKTKIENHKGQGERVEAIIINPAKILDPLHGLDHSEFMLICKAMILVSHAVVMLPGWEKSKGAYMEYEYAKENNRTVIVPGNSYLSLRF